jgi:hypothetical protein
MMMTRIQPEFRSWKRNGGRNLPGGYVFPVRLSPDARVCRVVLPINFWHVVSEQHCKKWKNVRESPLEYCARIGASEDEWSSDAGKVRLGLCPEGTTLGICEV